MKTTNQFIESQQELGREQLLTFYDFGNDGNFYFHPEKLDTLINQIIKNTGEELMRRAEGEKFKEFEYEHTHPNEIGVDMGNGYEKRIEKGQTETLTHRLTEEEESHNQAIDTLKKHITQLTGVE